MGKRKRTEQVRASRSQGGALETHSRIIHTSSGDVRLIIGSPRTVLGVSMVYACVRLIADAVSSATWGEWRGTEQLEASRLVRRPAQSMTRREWTWLVTATMALYNVAPLRRVGPDDSEGVIGSLVPVDPDVVTLDPVSGAWTYRGEDLGRHGVRLVRRALFPGMSWELVSILRLARDLFGAAWGADQYRSDYWASGGMPAVVLTTDQELTDVQAEAIAARWKQRRADDPHAPAVLGKGAHAERFGTDVGAEASAASLDRIGAEVARYFGVPAPLVNALSLASSLTYQNAETLGLDLVRYTLAPYADAIGDAVSEELPGDYLVGRRVRLDLIHLTRAEQESRYRAWESAIRAGWLAREEVRTAEGLAPELPATAGGTVTPALVAVPAQEASA